MQNISNTPAEIGDVILDRVAGGGQFLDHTVTLAPSTEGRRADRDELVTFFGQIIDHTPT